MVVGSLVFVAAARRVSLQAQLAVSTAMIGGAYLGMAAAGSLAVACTAGAIGGIGNGVQWVALMSSVQELTASRFQARVVGLLESIGRVMPGVGFLLGGVIAELLNPRASFVTAGVGALAVLAVAVPLLRGAEWQPEPEAAPPGHDPATAIDAATS
jgi:MFS family permease